RQDTALSDASVCTIGRSAMAGRKRKINRLTPSSPRRSLRPRKRQDISTMPEPEHSRLKVLAEVIRNLLTHKTDEGTIPERVLELVAFEQELAPYELLKRVSQFEAYHETYPNQHPANAFTPLLPGRTTAHQQERADRPATVSSDRELRLPPPPRMRPHI